MDLAVATGGARTLHVVQGQIGVTRDEDVIFTAIIGSCVVVCLSDPDAGVGGMAHFLFPSGGADCPKEIRFGPQAITALIQQIVDQGGEKARLRACVYGGAKLHHGRRDIGKRNADFAQWFLAEQGVCVAVSGLGGNCVRRIIFSPSLGTCKEVFISFDDPPKATMN